MTIKEYQQLPEGPGQLIDGCFVQEPSPNVPHHNITFRLAKRLDAHVEANSLGQVFIAPLDVYLSDRDVLQPDIFFVSKSSESKLWLNGLHGPPDLVVEVLSPSSRRRDRQTKRDIYARYGVAELWLIDPEAVTIERFVLQTDPETPTETIGATGSFRTSLLPELRISAAEVFRR